MLLNSWLSLGILGGFGCSINLEHTLHSKISLESFCVSGSLFVVFLDQRYIIRLSAEMLESVSASKGTLIAKLYFVCKTLN